MKKSPRKKSYTRLRFDSGQHRRILITMAVLCVLGFIPVFFRLYNLMVTQ